MQALYSKEIEEVENPENPRGPTLYRYTVFTESEGTTHKKVIQQGKDKVMDPMDLDFSFDDVDLGWQFKASNNALADIAAGKKALPKRIESNASQASAARTQCHSPGPRSHWPSRMPRRRTNCFARQKRQ